MSRSASLFTSKRPGALEALHAIQGGAVTSSLRKRDLPFPLYEQHGKEHGRELEDWPQAQSEVVQSVMAEAGYDLYSLWRAAL
jgi:hypothetical protein